MSEVVRKGLERKKDRKDETTVGEELIGLLINYKKGTPREFMIFFRGEKGGGREAEAGEGSC